MRTLCFALAMLVAGVGPGCRPAPPPGEPVAFEDLIRRLAQPERMARLDVPGTRLISSFDPAGSNDDFNHFVRKGPPGWEVMADVAGPGYVSRFWFTGCDPNVPHGLRIYIDDAAAPTLDTTVQEWCGGWPGVGAPLAAYENYCWYSYLPIPFQKRLVIMTQEGATRPGGWPRLFYQINYSSLPGRAVESFRGALSDAERAAVEDVRAFWSGVYKEDRGTAGKSASGRLALAPGSAGELLRQPGPARINDLRITLETSASAAARAQLLRDLLIRITWDGAPHPSVEAPLGDFFGCMWGPRRYRSMFFGMQGDQYISRWPMPFRTGAVITVENQGPIPVTVSAEARVEALERWDEALGYLHAAWNKTGPQDVGRPHPVLRALGRGKFVGCLLSATSFDKTWWLLEGDETIRVDAEKTPGWRGTGLEDYFNGGWYYQNVLVRPLHGLPFKAHFRTQQYRLQLVDPVYFNLSIDMLFERGPDQASHGDLESVAYYYGDRPYRAASRLETPARRAPPQDGFAQATVMLELCNFERHGDYQGARDHIDAFLERYPAFPFADALRLRQAAYDERLRGFAAARPAFEAAAQPDTHEAVRAQAEALIWFHEDPSHALLAMYCNLETTVYLDGEAVGQANSPEKLEFRRVTLSSGRHTLQVEGRKKDKPFFDWVQVALRTHHGQVVTTPDWRWSYGRAGSGRLSDAESDGTPRVGGTGIKGPPEEPFIWMEPNAFVDAQSQAVGLRPSDHWPPGQEYIVYHTTFDVP
jgi:hypothetical protein